jgi:hypothetical protein
MAPNCDVLPSIRREPGVRPKRERITHLFLVEPQLFGLMDHLLRYGRAEASLIFLVPVPLIGYAAVRDRTGPAGPMRR